MRMGEFFEAMDAFRKEAEAGRMHVGNLARGLGIRIWNLLVSKKDRAKDERKWWPMPWDEPDDTSQDAARELAAMSDEERQATVNEFLSKIRK